MWILWKTPLAVIIVFLQIQALISIKTTAVTSSEGQMFEFRCDYPAGWENNVKYFCRTDDDESKKNELQINQHDQWEEKGRFSAYDNSTGAFFIIRVNKLYPNDSGTYWCGVKLIDQGDHISVIQLNVSQVTEMHDSTRSHTVHKFTLQLFLTAMLCVAAMLFVCLFTAFLLMAVKQKKSAPRKKRETSTDYETMMPGVQAETEPCCCCAHRDYTDLSALPRPTSDLCSHLAYGQRESIVSFSLGEYVDVDVPGHICQYHHLDSDQLEEHVYHTLHGNNCTKQII
ncbi:CMRF35-like molecule 1 [Kryptolebias marmoratus]|uniref:CMRF35-like molecule 1 n=1 Tax=Kryptolebias marmoratus TaxID=37003 RepID=UPI0007F8F8A0|nr:CMRF35-like molecule 1 [Kryptolebias marmoratus]